MFFRDVYKFTRFILLSMLVLLVGCDQQGGTGSSDTDASPKITHLRFGHDMPETSAHHEGALRFAELVWQKSDGRIKIEVYPGQSLGTDQQMIAMAQNGELDIILPPTAKLSSLVPAMQLFDLPFLFSSADDVYRVMENEPGVKLLQLLAGHGLVGVSYWESGFKHLTANRPIESMDDLAKVRFRTMASEVIREQFAAWGARTTLIDFARTHAALADGIVTGQENPLGSIYNMGFYQVQSHLIMSQHAYLAQVLAFSKITFDALPPLQQKILKEAAIEATDFQRRRAQEIERGYHDKLRETGMTITQLPPDVRNEMAERARGVMEKKRHVIGTDVIELTQQVQDDGKRYSDDELVIALDADLAGNSALSGLAIRRGIELALEEINRDGGLLGKNLVLTARDNSMVSARGIDNIERFSRIPNLLAVFGGISSPVALSELDIIHEKKIVYLDPWAAATPIVSNNRDPNYVFRVSVRDEYAAGFLLPKALEVSDKVGLLLVNNGWGRSNHKALMDELKGRGLSPVSLQWFDWGGSEESHERKIEHLYQEGAEVIIYVGNLIEGAAFVRAIAARDKSIPVISHWGITGGEFVRYAGKALDLIDLRVLQTFSFIDNDNEKVRRIANRYLEKYRVDSTREIVAPTGTAHAYDLMHLLAMAVRNAKSADSEKVRDALEELGVYEGLVRTYRPPFTKERHDALDRNDFFLARYQNGVLVPLQ